ncbi:redoxin domain-containing protein [Anaerobacillus sp. HL2]|nr:redoxin domain-containing protein [Anaerobacillus sp. HL2]
MSDYRGDKNVFICFYPLDWTPVLKEHKCLHTRMIFLVLKSLIPRSWSISVDSVHSHNAWAKSIGGISYPLLADFYPHGVVCEKYGVFRTNPEELPMVHLNGLL